jgi:hypothetical protein
VGRSNHRRNHRRHRPRRRPQQSVVDDGTVDERVDTVLVVARAVVDDALLRACC